MEMREYGLVDILRFGLASTVMLSHEGAFAWDNSGNLAVQVFFALSGWLIGGILYTTERGELGRFYYNRSTRIWIPYFTAVFALYLSSLLHEPVRSSRWFEFLVYDLTFTHNWFTLLPDARQALAQMPLKGTGNHFWSLAVEEQFYLVAPIVMCVFPFGKKLLTWCVIGALAYTYQSQYAPIALGVLSAIIAQEFPRFHLGVRGGWVLITVFTLSSFLLTLPRIYGYVAPIFSVALVLLCAKPVSRNSLTRWLGSISFPFYLNAWMGVFVLHALEGHFAIRISAGNQAWTFLAGLAAGILSYLVIDRPVMAKRSRYYSPLIGWSLGASGYFLIFSGVVYWCWHSNMLSA